MAQKRHDTRYNISNIDSQVTFARLCLFVRMTHVSAGLQNTGFPAVCRHSCVLLRSADLSNITTHETTRNVPRMALMTKKSKLPPHSTRYCTPLQPPLTYDNRPKALETIEFYHVIIIANRTANELKLRVGIVLRMEKVNGSMQIGKGFDALDLHKRPQHKLALSCRLYQSNKRRQYGLTACRSGSTHSAVLIPTTHRPTPDADARIKIRWERGRRRRRTAF